MPAEAAGTSGALGEATLGSVEALKPAARGMSRASG